MPAVSTKWTSQHWFSVLLIGVLCACSKERTARNTGAVGDADEAGRPRAAPAAATSEEAPVVLLRLVRKPGVGVYVSDPDGRALYVVEDGAGKPVSCTGDCAKAWTPVAGPAAASLGDSAIQVALIGVVLRPDSTKQTTYAGKPLYYYHKDRAAHDTKGQGTREYGYTSYLVGPGGNALSGR
jgi:predicted lipoprotein with Yx(FWY)xxD motif